MYSQVRQRRSARAILLDDEGRVLLIRFVVPRNGANFAFWATPGGGVEDGETDLAAAEREISEELRLGVALTGPVHTASGSFEHENILTENTDIFFVGRCGMVDPLLSGSTNAEQAVMKTTKWWSAEDIEKSSETIFPSDLGAVVRRLA